MSVNDTAALFLKNFEKLKRASQSTLQLAASASQDVVHFEDTHAEPNVVISRVSDHKFFAGLMKSGRPVWSDNQKHAKQVSANLVDLYERRLGEELIPHWPYA